MNTNDIAGRRSTPRLAPVVFRTPKGPLDVSLIAVVACTGISVFMTAIAIHAVLLGNWGLGLFMMAVACFIAGLTAYSANDLRGKWGLRVALMPEALVLDLPAGRSLIHKPPAQRLTIPYADIAAIETRLEAYGQAGMEMMQRAYVLCRKNGELIFLFEDRAIGTPFESAMFTQIASDIAKRSGLSVHDLGMVEGQVGVLGVWGTHAADWAAPSLPEARQKQLWRAVLITGALPIPIIFIALIIRLLVG